MKQKLKKSLAFVATLVVAVTLLASSAFAAGGAIPFDRNGKRYQYVIGYMYSGSQQGINTREIFTEPNNYAIWLCPVCGLGDSNPEHIGTALASNLYMPCHGYDIPATGGDDWIRYACVRHRHNNGQLSDYLVYIPINVAMYSGCYYGYDTTPPSGPSISAPSGWQYSSATVRFEGGTDTGTSLPDWSATPGDYGSGINHYEYMVDNALWLGCPVGDTSLTITKGGITTITARTADGAGNASDQRATVQVYIDTVAPNAPTVTPSTTAWTNQDVAVTIKDNGDTYSGVARTEYSLDNGSWATGTSVTVSAHGKHTVSGRVIDNVGRISSTTSKTVLVDKVAPVISSVSQTPNSGHTAMTLAVSATDADSGVQGYAVTTGKTTPGANAFSTSAPTVSGNGTYYVWARDHAGNISSAKEIRVTALDIVPPTASVSTQRTWDANTNWAKVTASDDNSGVVAIGWASSASGTVSWTNASSTATFSFSANATYYAFARDLAGNVSKAVPFTIDRIDKHSPVIDEVSWDRTWSQSKTITVIAHDTESGLGQYAMTRSIERPTEWQDNNVFSGITENGTYYLWAKDNVQRVSGDPDASGSGDGPTEITIDTIDRSKPVMDAILHSSADNAPEGAFAYPYFNVVDRPTLTAHDLGDDGWTDSGIREIQYQFVPDGAELTGDWLTYDETEKPAMRDEFLGVIIARAIDNAGNISDPMEAQFLFETTPPSAQHVLQPEGWTNGTVKIRVDAQDAFSGVRDIALPDETMVKGSQAEFIVAENGSYIFHVRDNCENILVYPAEVTGIDLVPPEVVTVETQRDWDATTNWAKVSATDDASGVVAIGWASSEDGEITWMDADSTATFIFRDNATYYAFARDAAGNISAPAEFKIDRIDKHSPIIDDVSWDKAWSKSKTITVIAHDTESGLGQYAMTKTQDRPAEWQDDNVFPGITENGTYYLWARDNVGRVSADPDADSGSEGGDPDPGPGPTEITIDTIDRTKPVMDAIIHSSTDNAPPDVFSYPCFNEIDRPTLTAHDLGDNGWRDSGIREIQYQFVPDGAELTGDWLTYDETEKPAMRDEFFGVIIARAIDNAGNISDPLDAQFLFETTPPTASHLLDPSTWTNGKVKIGLAAEDAFSGVYRITLPDGTVLEQSEAEYTVGQNGVYTFLVQDYCGNELCYLAEVANIDLLKPTAAYQLLPENWTNKPVTVRVIARDPVPDDGYNPSGIHTIVLPDGEVQEKDTVEFVADQNGKYDFTITDRAGNQLVLKTEVSNIDYVAPTVEWHFEALDEAGRTVITQLGETEYYNYNLKLIAQGKDDYSGLDRYEYRVGEGDWQVFDPGTPPIFTDEQISTVRVRVWDKAGNVSAEITRDFVLDKTPPALSHTLDPNEKTKGKVTINIGADGDICGVESIVKPDGTVVYATTGTAFDVTQNGRYLIVCWDRCGNRTDYWVTVDNIVSGAKPIVMEPDCERPEPPTPEQEGPDAPAQTPAPRPASAKDNRALTLLDLFSALVVLGLAIAAGFKRKNKEEDEDEDAEVLEAGQTASTSEQAQATEDKDEKEKSEKRRRHLILHWLLALVSIVLFFVTQPLVWRFRWIDWWTLLFVLLVIAAAALFLLDRRKNEDEQDGEDDTNLAEYEEL